MNPALGVGKVLGKWFFSLIMNLGLGVGMQAGKCCFSFNVGHTAGKSFSSRSFAIYLVIYLLSNCYEPEGRG
jgi:hypothetical protein